MRRHSRGFDWAIKPPAGVLQLNPAHPLCPTISFPLDDMGQQGVPGSGLATEAIFTLIRNLGVTTLSAFATGEAASLSAVQWRPTRWGIAARLGGSFSSYIDAGSKVIMRPTGPFSLEVWIHNTVWDTNVGIAGSWDGNGYMLYSSGGAARAYINGTFIIGATALPTTGLIHLLETYDGATVKLYLDGREDATGAASGLAASAVPWQAGAYASSGGAFWTGDARYLMINLWNGRCLLTGDVRQRFLDPFGIFLRPRLHPRGRVSAAVATPYGWFVPPLGPDRTPPTVIGYET